MAETTAETYIRTNHPGGTVSIDECADLADGHAMLALLASRLTQQGTLAVLWHQGIDHGHVLV